MHVGSCLATGKVVFVFVADVALLFFAISWGTEGVLLVHFLIGLIARNAGAKSLRQVFGAKGVTIDNVAKSGSTAEQWARNPNSLRDAVRKNPDAKWVWLTIGGLDLRSVVS